MQLRSGAVTSTSVRSGPCICDCVSAIVHAICADARGSARGGRVSARIVSRGPSIRGTRTLSFARRSSSAVSGLIAARYCTEQRPGRAVAGARAEPRCKRRRSRRLAAQTFEPEIAAPRRAIRPSAGVARSPGRRPDEAARTRGAQGTSDPLSPTPAPPRGGHYGLGTRVVLGSILPATVTDDEDPAVYPAGGPDRQWPS
jgi:hypothetical protein